MHMDFSWWSVIFAARLAALDFHPKSDLSVISKALSTPIGAARLCIVPFFSEKADSGSVL